MQLARQLVRDFPFLDQIETAAMDHPYLGRRFCVLGTGQQSTTGDRKTYQPEFLPHTYGHDRECGFEFYPHPTVGHQGSRYCHPAGTGSLYLAQLSAVQANPSDLLDEPPVVKSLKIHNFNKYNSKKRIIMKSLPENYAIA